MKHKDGGGRFSPVHYLGGAGLALFSESNVQSYQIEMLSDTF